MSIIHWTGEMAYIFVLEKIFTTVYTQKYLQQFFYVLMMALISRIFYKSEKYQNVMAFAPNSC